MLVAARSAGLFALRAVSRYHEFPAVLDTLQPAPARAARPLAVPGAGRAAIGRGHRRRPRRGGARQHHGCRHAKSARLLAVVEGVAPKISPPCRCGARKDAVCTLVVRAAFAHCCTAVHARGRGHTCGGEHRLHLIQAADRRRNRRRCWRHERAAGLGLVRKGLRRLACSRVRVRICCCGKARRRRLLWCVVARWCGRLRLHHAINPLATVCRSGARGGSGGPRRHFPKAARH